MKAMVYTAPEGLELREVPMPVPAEGEALVRIGWSGICGSDMHAYLGHDARRPAPLILGHEASGIIEDSGRRVTINPLVTCGRCAACSSGRTNLCAERQIISMPPREGAFAEYVAIPEGNLVTVPEDASLQSAALTEPLACGWHGVRLAQETLGTLDGPCLVLGGGAIGLGAALSLVAFGAQDITLVEPNGLRREVLNDLAGFAAVEAVPQNDHYALTIDGVGYAATRAAASAATRPGGVIVHIGLGEAEGGLDIRRMTLQEISFIGTYTYTAQDFRDCAAAIFDGRMGDCSWVETRPLDAGPQAFADIRAGRVAAPKILLVP